MKRFIANSKKDTTILERREIYNNGTFHGIPDQKIVEKVWGSENSIGFEPYYTVKIMTLTPGQQCSLHSHCKKVESFYLIEGEMVIETVNTKTGNMTISRLTDRFDNITIDVDTPHRFYCPEGQETETIFIEVSTADLDDDNKRYFPSGKK